MITEQVKSKIDMGALEHLKILCISETGWFDTPTLLADVKAAGGMDADQYDFGWPPLGPKHPENAAGSSALVEAEVKDGQAHKFLFDTGWGPEWMDKRFAEEGIDGMLKRGEIEFLVISHEHFDHFWGLRSVVKHCSHLPIYVPRGFRREGFEFIQQVGHTGKVTVVEPDQPAIPFPGFAITSFAMETLGRVRGENVLYFSLINKGLTLMTGCGHGGILNLLEYGRNTFLAGDRIYAVYGGLHISPFGEWDEKQDAIVQALRKYDIQHFGCNHCTGEKAVRRMIELGFPVVHGTARHGSKTDLYLGNGDTLDLGGE
jgi:7,8-dihydropterin-6-yl-methyl-4-(beta-D-ribofuranosyl)aminobenzene 5'-phosphate synthase